jgi:hypothetical protein
MPNSLQYPLERHRDLQRRWQRLLQRTATPKNSALVDPLGYGKSNRSSVTVGGPNTMTFSPSTTRVAGKNDLRIALL